MLVKIDTESYKQKPENQFGYIKGRFRKIQAKMYDPSEVIKNIEQGKAIQPTDSKGIKAEDWIAQNTYLVDIDNDKDGALQTIEKSLEICNKYNIHPIFIYETFSSTIEKPKYRLVFCMNETITDTNRRKLILETLIRLFPQADSACKNADRIFLGTNKKICYIEEGANLSYDDIIRINGELPHVVKAESIILENKIYEGNGIDLYEEINNFDFFTFLKNECGVISINGSNYTMFHECPICHGHDDLVHYHGTKTYTCFGTGETGNIITYLAKTRGMTKLDAVKHFLHELCGYSIDQISAKSISTSTTLKINNEVSKMLSQFSILETKPEEYSRDDKGMSELFALIIKDKLRYNVDRKMWMYYNGKVWVNDTGSARVNKYAKYFTDAMMLHSVDEELFKDISNSKQRAKAVEDFRKSLIKLGSKDKRDSIVKDATSEFPIYNNDLDKNTNLFNLQNGTLNLKTLELQSHNADDLLSMVATVEYNPKATSKVFEDFLNQIFEIDKAKIHYLQKIMGYCLTASTKEETFFILFGPTTRNGKSTYIEVIIFMLGDYAKQSNPETFAVKKFSDSRSASSDIARLRSCRLVNISELPQNMILDTAKMKAYTGGDTITARELYQNEFQFKPNFKIFMTTNHLPQVNDDTLFASKRVNVITFDRHFTEKEQDKNLKKKLLDPEILSEILHWCIDGLSLYRKEGLQPPECVIKANQEFWESCDIIRAFLNDNFVESEKSTKLQEAYNLYCHWCNVQGICAENKQTFNSLLRNRGVTATVGGIRNMLKNLVYKNEIF